jgi:hypothetical protein
MTLSQKDAVNQYFVHTEADMVKTDAWPSIFASSDAKKTNEKKLSETRQQQIDELKSQLAANTELYHNILVYREDKIRELQGSAVIKTIEDLEDENDKWQMKLKTDKDNHR